METRLKELRKALRKTQAEFAKDLKIATSTYTMIETGKRELLDRHIELICIKFNVNETWLRTGTGEMFDSANPNLNLMSRLAQEYRLTDLEKQIVEIYLQLPPPQKESITEFLRQVATLFAQGDTNPVLHIQQARLLRPSARGGTNITVSLTPKEEEEFSNQLSELPEEPDF